MFEKENILLRQENIKLPRRDHSYGINWEFLTKSSILEQELHFQLEAAHFLAWVECFLSRDRHTEENVSQRTYGPAIICMMMAAMKLIQSLRSRGDGRRRKSLCRVNISAEVVETLDSSRGGKTAPCIWDLLKRPGFLLRRGWRRGLLAHKWKWKKRAKKGDFSSQKNSCTFFLDKRIWNRNCR